MLSMPEVVFEPHSPHGPQRVVEFARAVNKAFARIGTVCVVEGVELLEFPVC